MNPIEYLKPCQCTGARTKKRESVMTKIETHEKTGVRDGTSKAKSEGLSLIRATLNVILSAGAKIIPE